MASIASPSFLAVLTSKSTSDVFLRLRSPNTVSFWSSFVSPSSLDLNRSGAAVPNVSRGRLRISANSTQSCFSVHQLCASHDATIFYESFDESFDSRWVVSEKDEYTGTSIITSKGKKPKCADANDELVEVIGEVGSVRDALVQVVLRLRDDVLKDKNSGHNPTVGADSLFSGGAVFSLPSVAPASCTIGRAESGSGLGMLSSRSLYGFGSISVYITA